jgi:hypothetical protein
VPRPQLPLQLTLDLGLKLSTKKLLETLEKENCEIVYTKIGKNLIFIPPNGWILYLCAKDIPNDTNHHDLKTKYLEFHSEHPQGVCIIERYYRYGTNKKQYLQESFLDMFTNNKDLFFGVIPTNSTPESAFCIKTLASRIQIADNPPILARVSSSSPLLYKAQEFFIEGLLNCGSKKAKILLERFDTPNLIIQTILSEPDKILAIKGFGEKFITTNQTLLKKYFTRIN